MIHEYMGKLVGIELHDKSNVVGLLHEAEYVDDVYTINILKNNKLISIDPKQIKNIYRIQEKANVKITKREAKDAITRKDANKTVQPAIFTSKGKLTKESSSNQKQMNYPVTNNLVINEEEMSKQLDTYGPSLNQFSSVVAQNIYYFQKMSLHAKSICLIIREAFCSDIILFELLRLLDCNCDIYCDATLPPSLKYLDNLFFLRNLNIKKVQPNLRYDLLIVASDEQIDLSYYKALNYICMYNPQQSINKSIETGGKKYTLIYGPKPPKKLLETFKDQQFVYIYGGLSKYTYKSFRVPAQDGNCFISLKFYNYSV